MKSKYLYAQSQINHNFGQGFRLCQIQTLNSCWFGFVVEIDDFELLNIVCIWKVKKIKQL